MTEKRFTAFTDYLGGTQTILDNGERKTLQELLDTMNELAEENEELKQENKELQFAYDECSNNKLFSRRKLETENKNLKDENIRLSKDKQLAETEIIRIRQTLNDTIETERTNIGQSVLKQFKEAIQ